MIGKVKESPVVGIVLNVPPPIACICWIPFAVLTLIIGSSGCHIVSDTLFSIGTAGTAGTDAAEVALPFLGPLPFS